MPKCYSSIEGTPISCNSSSAYRFFILLLFIILLFFLHRHPPFALLPVVHFLILDLAVESSPMMNRDLILLDSSAIPDFHLMNDPREYTLSKPQAELQVLCFPMPQATGAASQLYCPAAIQPKTQLNPEKPL